MEIELIRIFVKIVQNGSFSKAALLLKVPKSTVSKALTRLEQQTGTKLLLRTTRSLTLTAAGRAFYETCLGPIQVLEDAEKSLYGADSILSGVIRLTAPEDLGAYVIAGAVGDLVKKHPALSFELIYTNEVLDLVKEGIDIAIRLGNLKESNLKAKKIGEMHLVLIASAAYLRNKPPLKRPQDLQEHSCLSITETTKRWSLVSKKGPATVLVEPRIQCNQMSSLIQAALGGAGIAFVPRFLAKDSLASGKLIRVLPEWRGTSYTVSLISPLSSMASGRLKVVADHLQATVKGALEAE